MTAPVDVLAVMDKAAVRLSHYAGAAKGPGQAESRERLTVAIEEARAAVAELIEAATRANGEHTAPHDCYATGPLTGDPFRDLVSCPGCELAAALARVSGGAK